MRHPLLPPPLDARIQVAWQTHVAAVKTPGVPSELMRRRHELLPRVAAYYTHLQALPRRVRRALHREWGLPLAILALWLALGQHPVLAATIAVGGPCTLVDALTAANTDTATGGCAAGSGTDTIVLPAGSTQTLRSVHNDTYGPTGLPVIRSVITIAGRGSTITRANGAPDFRLFAVNSTGDLTLRETTVSGGATSFGRNGGGVANYGGSVTVRYSTISDNAAVEYYAPDYYYYYCSGGWAGGVHNGGTLTVTNSTIRGNSAVRGGGVGGFGSCTVTNSIITGNTALAFHRTVLCPGRGANAGRAPGA